MKNVFTFFFVVASLVTIVRPLYPHHLNRGGRYDMENQATLTGTVSRFDWRNPHVVIHMDVTASNGEVVTWSFEDVGVSQLVAEGYTRNALRPGMEITAVFNPAADGGPTGVILRVMLDNGEEIMIRDLVRNPRN